MFATRPRRKEKSIITVNWLQVWSRLWTHGSVEKCCLHVEKAFSDGWTEMLQKVNEFDRKVLMGVERLLTHTHHDSVATSSKKSWWHLNLFNRLSFISKSDLSIISFFLPFSFPVGHQLRHFENLKIQQSHSDLPPMARFKTSLWSQLFDERRRRTLCRIHVQCTRHFERRRGARNVDYG